MADKTSPWIRPWRLTGTDWISRALPLITAVAAATLVFFRWANWHGSPGFGGGSLAVNLDGINLLKGQLVLGATVLAAVAISRRWHLVAAALSTGAFYLCALTFLDMAGSFLDGDHRSVGWALGAEIWVQVLLVLMTLVAAFKAKERIEPVDGMASTQPSQRRR